MSSRPRRPIPEEIEAELLVRSSRRCCLCVFLLGDVTLKLVQVAHITRERSSVAYRDLAVLCLHHHDEYDSRRSQSKGITVAELRRYKQQLEEQVAQDRHSIRIFEDSPSKSGDVAAFDEGGALTTPVSLPKTISDRLVASIGRSQDSSDPEILTFLKGMLQDSLVGAERFPAASGFSVRALRGAPAHPRAIEISLQYSNGELGYALSFRSGRAWYTALTGMTYGAHVLSRRTGFVPGPSTSAFVLEEHLGGGTGILLRRWNWYSVTRTATKKILSLHGGYVVGWTGVDTDVEFIPLEYPANLTDGATLRALEIVRIRNQSPDGRDLTPFPTLAHVEELTLTWKSPGLFLWSSRGPVARHDGRQKLSLSPRELIQAMPEYLDLLADSPFPDDRGSSRGLLQQMRGRRNRQPK